MNPLISVIIPYYKAEKYIDQCVESLLSQTLKDIEIIIAVDIKDNEGMKYLESKNWPAVRVIRGGNDVSANRNAGLKEAKGQYIFFIDADDFLLRDDALEVLLKGLAESGADLAVGEYNAFTKAKGLTEANRLPKEGPSLIEALEAMRIHFERDVLFVAAWNVLIKRELIGELLFDEGMTVSEDDSFMLSILHKKPKVFLAKGKVTYAYRYAPTEGHMATKPIIKRTSCWVKVLEQERAIVEEDFPELKDIMWHDYFFTLSSLLIGLALPNDVSKEKKALFKEVRKRYLSFGKLSKQYMTSRKERVRDLLVRTNTLWRVYRILRALSPKKRRG